MPLFLLGNEMKDYVIKMTPMRYVLLFAALGVAAYFYVFYINDVWNYCRETEDSITCSRDSTMWQLKYAYHLVDLYIKPWIFQLFR